MWSLPFPLHVSIMVTSIAAASSEKADLLTELIEGGDPANHVFYHSLNITFWMGSAPGSKATNP